MIFPSLVIMLALVVYFVLAVNVAIARGTYGVKAPATAGHPDFERRFRVHQNMSEELIIFIPSLWFCGLFWTASWADAPKFVAAMGVVWLIGRIIYAVYYYAAAEKRTLGWIISTLATLILMLGAIAGILKTLYVIYHP